MVWVQKLKKKWMGLQFLVGRQKEKWVDFSALLVKNRMAHSKSLPKTG